MNITELVLEIRPEKKIQACTGLGAALYHWANKSTGS